MIVIDEIICKMDWYFDEILYIKKGEKYILYKSDYYEWNFIRLTSGPWSISKTEQNEYFYTKEELRYKKLQFI